MNKNEDVKNLAQSVLKEHQTKKQGRQFILWILALVVGAALGWLGIKPLNELFNFIATVFTRLFQFIAVPTIALSSRHWLHSAARRKPVAFLHTRSSTRFSLPSLRQVSGLRCISG